MLIKDKYGYYQKVETLPDGRVIVFSSYDLEEKALATGFISYMAKNLQEELSTRQGEVVPLTLENLTIGDWLRNAKGGIQIILGASGYGYSRIYAIEEGELFIEHRTAQFLKERGYTPFQPDCLKEKERTVEDVLAGLPDADKEIVKKAIK